MSFVVEKTLTTLVGFFLLVFQYVYDQTKRSRNLKMVYIINVVNN